MSANKAIQSFIAFLQTMPGGIAASHIGRSGPAGASDLPILAVSMRGIREAPAGIGGLLKVEFDGTQWNSSAGGRTTGVLQMEIWAAAAADLSQLTDTLLTFFDTSAAALASAGFAVFRAESLRAGEGVQLADASKALRGRLDFAVVHEDITSPPADTGVIQEIDVGIDGQFNEQMKVT